MIPPDGSRRRWRRDPSRPPFSGWRIVGLCAVLQIMAGPGQTIGVSVFIDPMMATLDLTRSQVSTAYLFGTLGGALGLPLIGRVSDVAGPKKSIAVVGLAFGAALLGMMGVRGILSLAVGFVGIRMLGQGALTMLSTTTPIRWFRRKRGMVVGVTNALGGIAAVVPLLSAALILAFGWRVAWLILAIIVWVVILPIARWGIIDDPADVGQQIDGLTDAEVAAAQDEQRRTSPAAREVAFTGSEAIRTPMYWAITCASFSTFMLTTALGFHQVSVLGQQGLTPIEAAANFIPQTISGLAATFSVGVLIDRFRQRWILTGMMGLLATSMVMVLFVRPGLSVIVYGLVLGSTQGTSRSVEAASYAKMFGIRHAGEIRGRARAILVAGSALGPLLLAYGFSVTGTYARVLLLSLIFPVGSTIVALLAPDPRNS